MSVLTDIEVLRETIAKLKTKTLNSRRRFGESCKEKVNYVEGLANRVEKLRKEHEGEPVNIAETVLQYVNEMRQLLIDLMSQAIDHFEDLDIYVSTLESYYAKKDEELQKAIEDGKKEAEKDKEQEEAIRKRPVDYAK